MCCVHVLKLVYALFDIFGLGKVLWLCLTKVSGKNQSFTNWCWFCKICKVVPEVVTKPKWQDTQKSEKSRIAKTTKLAKLLVLSAKKVLTLVPPCTVNYLVVLIETLLYCIFCIFVNCLLTELLAECKRFKPYQSTKWLKVKIKSVPSSFFGFTFLYLPNVFLHEPNEFIHVRVVNKLSKFKFTVQRLSDLVLAYSVGRLPDCTFIWWERVVWCLHPGHCYSSTHLLWSLSTISSSISLAQNISL